MIYTFYLDPNSNNVIYDVPSLRHIKWRVNSAKRYANGRKFGVYIGSKLTEKVQQWIDDRKIDAVISGSCDIIFFANEYDRTLLLLILPT